MQAKIAIITSGGGFKSSYTAGSLLALAKHHGLKNPDILIAASGSAATGAYFTTGQYNVIRQAWTN
ncbi:MAG: hypothetical protein GF332_01910, partial [Candidatus Moranbacteria bacterium]|nr:hypothetical protein [Candidatus Moranbacteria bacterium]